MRIAMPPLVADLRSRVQAGARDRPGIYRFLGPRGEILYVGKSVRIRTRLLSWLRSRSGEKGWELLRVTRGIEWEYVPNEFEALLREFRLIRSARPRFNVHHRRDRRFAWVGITHGSAPGLRASRAPSHSRGLWFGPFPAPRHLPLLLRSLAHVQGLRDCPASTPVHFADQLDLLAPVHTPLCLRGGTGSCLAPCAAGCNAAGYGERVRETVAFLRGDCDAPLERLELRMSNASARREYEAAARFRDAAEGLRALRDEIVSFRDWLRGLTFLYRVPGLEDRVRSYLVIAGRVRLAFDEDRAPGGILTAIRGILAAVPRDPASLSSWEREELFLTIRWFRARPTELLRTEVPEQWLAARGTPHVAGGSVDASTETPLRSSDRGRPSHLARPPRTPTTESA